MINWNIALCAGDGLKATCHCGECRKWSKMDPVFLKKCEKNRKYGWNDSNWFLGFSITASAASCHRWEKHIESEMHKRALDGIEKRSKNKLKESFKKGEMLSKSLLSAENERAMPLFQLAGLIAKHDMPVSSFQFIRDYSMMPTISQFVNLRSKENNRGLSQLSTSILTDIHKLGKFDESMMKNIEKSVQKHVEKHKENMKSFDEKNTLPQRWRTGSNVNELIASIAETIRGLILQKIKCSPVYTILIDESTDISNTSNMVIYAMWLENPDTQPEVNLSFLDIVPLRKGATASKLLDELSALIRKFNLDKKKLFGFSSDGASVMFALAELLREWCKYLVHLHCIAHKTALGAKDTRKNDEVKEVLDRLDDLVNKLAKTFNMSPKHAGKYRKNLDILKKCILNKKIAKFKDLVQLEQNELRKTSVFIKSISSKLFRIKEVRWLSRGESYKQFVNLYIPLLKYARFMATEEKSRERRETYDDIKKQLLDYQFFKISHIEADILHALNMLLTPLQTSAHRQHFVDIEKNFNDAMEQLDSLLESPGRHEYASDKKLTYEEKENEKLPSKFNVSGNLEFLVEGWDEGVDERIKEWKKKHIEQLKVNLNTRFSMRKEASASRIFAPENLLKTLKKENISLRDWHNKSLAQQRNKLREIKYGKEELETLISHFGLHPAESEMEWDSLREFIGKNLNERISYAQLYKESFESMKNVGGELSRIGRNMLLLAFNTSDCERGFSRMNNIKTRIRNKIGSPLLRDLMMIALGGSAMFGRDDRDFWRNVARNKIMENSKKILFQQDINIFN